MVIVEDAAALVGIAIAFTGVVLTQVFHNTLYDGIASIVIGVLLTVVAILLVAETKGLLVGESASKVVRESIKTIVKSDEAVSDMGPPITLHLGPKDVLLAMNIEFHNELSADDIEAAVRRIEKKHSHYPRRSEPHLYRSRLHGRRSLEVVKPLTML